MAKDIIKYIKNINRKPSVPITTTRAVHSEGYSTIPELSKGIGVSLPTTTNALNELMGQDCRGRSERKPIPLADPDGLRPWNLPQVTLLVWSPEMDCLALAVSDFTVAI